MERSMYLFFAIPAVSILIEIAVRRRRKKSVADWMNERRVVVKRKDNKVLCGVCGDKMSKRVRHTGNKAGVEHWVCNSFPKCRKVEICE